MNFHMFLVQSITISLCLVLSVEISITLFIKIPSLQQTTLKLIVLLMDLLVMARKLM